ncbi:MAG: hypothetical protein HRT42_13690 [Campylobacteraceae bacterium]|nr:hypothetical protein [Campylobacteraceae bacterium]
MSSPFQRAFCAKSPLKHEGKHPHTNSEGYTHVANDHQIYLEPTDELPNKGRNVVTGESQSELMDRKVGNLNKSVDILNEYVENLPELYTQKQVDHAKSQFAKGQKNIDEKRLAYEKSRDSIADVNKNLLNKVVPNINIED